ncbi:MAG TPA: hypothetical protein VI731_09420 [Bacteroidia bacterium]|nr:hypothetical protein [Bacteroidia bacterium]
MKFSLHNGHLSPAALRAYLGGKLQGNEKLRADELLEECDLSRDAVEGFSCNPAALADLPALQKKIEINSGLKNPAWMNVTVITAGIGIVAVSAWFILGNKQEINKRPINPDQATIAEPVQNALPVLTPQSEHFVNPDAKLSQAITKRKTPVADSQAGKNISVPGKEVFAIPVLQPSPLSIPASVIVTPHPGYNASVVFILDLKVTDFEKLYKGTTIIKRGLRMSGVPAQFDDEKDRDRINTDEETVNLIPAENFLREGLQAFRDGRYGRCIEKMETLKKNNPADINALFYIGASYVKLEMHGKAIPFLDQVLNSSNNVFHEEAIWYKALALIGSGQMEAGNKLLEEIAEGQGFYQAKAKELLEE